MSMGYASMLGIDSSNPTTVAFEFQSESLRKQATIIDPSGIWGSRSHRSERTRAGNYTVSGSIEMFPSYRDLSYLLPWILGANASGTTYALAETVPSRYVQIDRVGKVFTYAGVYVNRATFTGSEGTPVRLVLDLIGQTETVGNASTFPSITPGSPEPFLFSDGALSVLSTSRSFKDFTVVVDNHLDVAFNNSVTASRITTSDRTVSVSLLTPYTSSETDLYNQALAGAAATITFTDTVVATSVLFTFGALQFPASSPVVAGKGEIPLRLDGIARMLSTTRELVVTLDSTP